MGAESGTSFALCAEDFRIGPNQCVIARADGSFVRGKVLRHVGLAIDSWHGLHFGGVLLSLLVLAALVARALISGWPSAGFLIACWLPL